MTSQTRHTEAWVLRTQNGPASLEFVQNLEVPPLKEYEVLVRINGASLNYRELVIANGVLPLKRERTIPSSDGAGVVQEVGTKVTAFSVGDLVCTHLTCGLSEIDQPSWDDVCAGLGHGADGTLRKLGIFHETSLVKMPTNLSFLEAATLSCSGLTAWNALFGLEGKVPKTGDTIVVQGTGGVSIAALQFALAAGANVIATTSTNAKADMLKSLGVSHVVNYRDNPDWGQQVKSLTVDGKGANVVVDVGGNSTLRQSLKAVRIDGLVVATGILGEAPDGKIPTVLDCIMSYCTVRGILLGSRKQFADMNRFIEKHNVKPVLDKKTFDMDSVREAYTHLEGQKHFSKIGIELS